jgi:hypothetical protein
MLVSSIEAFLNHILPNEFIYRTIRKKKEVEFNKIDIESPKISFKEKLTDVIPQYLKTMELNPNLELENSSILNLYKNRKNLIHLKTSADDDLTAYFDEIDIMLELDLNDTIRNVLNYMNKVKPEFIELENH